MGYQIDGVAIVTGAGKYPCRLTTTKSDFNHQAVESARHARSHTPLKAREESL